MVQHHVFVFTWLDLKSWILIFFKLISTFHFKLSKFFHRQSLTCNKDDDRDCSAAGLLLLRQLFGPVQGHQLTLRLIDNKCMDTMVISDAVEYDVVFDDDVLVDGGDDDVDELLLMY